MTPPATNEQWNFEGKTVLITGATGQLGTALCQAFADLSHHQANDLLNLVLSEGIKDHHLIYPVQELRAEGFLQRLLQGYPELLTLRIHISLTAAEP